MVQKYTTGMYIFIYHENWLAIIIIISIHKHKWKHTVFQKESKVLET